jgi:hypothetical protein
MTIWTFVTYKSSEYHFHRVFDAMTGETLNDFTNRQRLEKAARLLTTTRQSATEIALECGFSSSATFSRSFNKALKTKLGSGLRRQDPFQPPVRQAERPAPNPGRAVGKRVGIDSVVFWSAVTCPRFRCCDLSRQCWRQVARLPKRRQVGALQNKALRRDYSLTQMGDSYRCRANSPESMTTSRAAPVMFTPGI